MYPSPTKEERYADGVTHVVGILALLAIVLALFVQSGRIESEALTAAIWIYAAFAALSTFVSAAYHQLPLHEWRLWLRRIDHAAIYPVIAGTFTPLLVISGSTTAYWILTAMWVFAVPGILFKLFGKNLDARWSLASYIGMGWFGVLALPDFWQSLPTIALIGIGAGALFYSVGALFYRNKTLRYRYAIWHTFGLGGALSFFFAVWVSLPR